MPLESVEFCNVTLEKIRLQVQTRVSRAVMDSMMVEDLSKVLALDLAGGLLLKLRATVPGREDRVVLDSVTVPATWWDAFKERWAPWLGWNKRVIATKTTVYHVCPHVELPKTAPSLQRHWNFLRGGA